MSEYWPVFIENALDAIVVCDPNGVIQEINKSALVLFHIANKDNVIGNNFNIFLLNADINTYYNFLSQSLQSPEELKHKLFEFSGLYKNNEPIDLEAAISVVSSTQGMIVIHVIRNITQRKHIENNLREYAEKLEQKQYELLVAKYHAEESDRLKSDFLANISHELRTPMNAILGFSRLGVQLIDKQSKEETTENFRIIHESGLRLLNLLNDLLDLSKLEADSVRFDMRPFSLITIVKEIQRQLHSLLQEKNLTLEINIPEILPKIELDKAKISQVFFNLLSNAIQYSPPNKTIKVSSLLKENRVIVSIYDEGAGIPENELCTIFDKFIQSSKTKTGAGGTGLGLAICREIIRRHHGSIEASNLEHGGAKFSFSLPLSQVQTIECIYEHS